MDRKLREYLFGRGFTPPPDETFDHIDKWLQWYQGEVKKFHNYTVYNGVLATNHRRHSLSMAKKITEDWANLLLNEKVRIKCGDFTDQLEEILEANNFRVRANQLVEITYALGTGAFVEYLDAEGEVVIDYLRADMIYPLSWDNGDITECAFGTERTIDGKKAIYLQIHRFGNEEDEEDPRTYYIENTYVDAESAKEIEPPEEIDPVINTGSEEPLFQIITPNIFNNIDLDSPFGVSVYANAIEQLKGCDLVYDSYINEFVLGRKRIIVPISMAKMQMEKDGVAAPVFDPNDNIYYAMPDDRQGDLKLTEVDMKIRAQEHELAIQRNLDVLSMMAGMGTGRYQFNSSGVKTATEVISDKSDLYQNRQKNCIVIRVAVTKLAKAVAFLSGKTLADVTVDFDDSIIEDSNSIIDKNIKLVTAGLRSKISAIMEIDKCSEAEAQTEMQRIAGDNQITGQDIDWTGGDEDDDQDDGKQQEPESTDEDEDETLIDEEEEELDEFAGKSKAGRAS